MNEPNVARPTSPGILFVDDEATSVKYFQRAIGTLAPVLTGSSVEEGKAFLDSYGDVLAVLVSDQRMPGECGNELLRYAREKYPHIVRILTTAYSEIEHTVEAVNLGEIHRYIKKPWDITALRMEMRQALELSHLRSERDNLMREKLNVLQKQTIATRIGLLAMLSATLVGVDRFRALEAYLGSAALVGVPAVGPDWTIMDYADVIAAESRRGGDFAYRVSERLSELQALPATDSYADALDAMVKVIGAESARGEANSLIWLEPIALIEFLGERADRAVSDRHVAWVATLLWLEQRGFALEPTRSDHHVVFRQCDRTMSFDPSRVAMWIEQF